MVALILLLVGHVVEFRAAEQGRQGALSVGRPVALAGAASWRRRVKPSEGTLWFAACSVLYLAVGAYLVLHRGSIVGDAEARVAQAWYVLASRDPHLGAIGFVWNPLPSVAAIPLVMLRDIWPALTQRAFAGSVVSAICMGGAVVQFRAALREFGASSPMSIVLTACFALNPMTIYYGANGMSEAMYLLFLVGAARHLLTWSVTGRQRSLVLTAVYLALGYLTRYEMLAAAAVASFVVFSVGTNARNHSSNRRERMVAASTDVIVVAVPTLVAFLGWMIVGWLITGQPFEQFTSRYGNASIIAASGGTSANGTGWPKLVLALVQVMSYAPLVVFVGVVIAVIAIRRRDRRFLALGVLIGPLAFSILSYVDGQIFGFLRYYIPVLPLYLLAVGLLLSPLPTMSPRTPTWLTRDSVAGVVVALVLGIPGIVGSTLAMGNTHIGPAEEAALGWLFKPAHSPAELQTEEFLPSAQQIARKVDQLGFGESSIVLDTFNCGSLIVMNSRDPHQFIITSDRDFEEIVADPLAFGVSYLLVPDNDQGIDAISVAHPGIFLGGRTGDMQTQIVAQYKTTGCPEYRLLRVISEGS